MQFHTPLSRRLFLQHGVTLASLIPTLPAFIERSALGMVAQAAGGTAGIPDERILVIIQLGGGNDGLNTVVPYGASEYFNARPSIAIGVPGSTRGGAGAAIELDQAKGIGLHPALTGLKELYDDGLVTVVQGTGYPNPNRSHFTSMDIWQTARTDGKGNGWVGRYFDATCNGTPAPEGAVAMGRQAPLALMGDVQKPIAFESAELFEWLGKDLHGTLAAPYESINRRGTLDGVEAETQASFLMRTALDAQISSERIRTAVAKRPLVEYPGSGLARQLQTIGAMIRDGMRTRVYYASLSGFDTHSGQVGSHANLMGQLGGALRAFQNDLKAQGNEGRVVTMCFSEFGRRVRQNASAGTDHGTAAPLFLVGAPVRPGILGEHPSLVDLDQGDLKHTVDFRSVYAGILEDWLRAPSEKVLGGTFPKAALFRGA